MDNPYKTIIIFIPVRWVIDKFRIKKKRSDPGIEEFDARERHKGRYLRWEGPRQSYANQLA